MIPHHTIGALFIVLAEIVIDGKCLVECCGGIGVLEQLDVASSFGEPREVLVDTFGFGNAFLGDFTSAVGCPGFIGVRTERTQQLRLAIRQVHNNENIIKRKPCFGRFEFLIRDRKIRAIIPCILNDQHTFGIVISGDELVMSEPCDLTGVIFFVITFFRDKRKACRKQSLGDVDVAPETRQRAELSLVIDKFHHLVRHHVDVTSSLLDKVKFGILHPRLDRTCNIVPVALPADKVQRHAQIRGPAIVPAVLLVFVAETCQIN